MIATFPAVQAECSRVKRYVCYSSHRAQRNHSGDKRTANRRHRRYLNAVTRAFINDPDGFDGECFTAPTLSSWDLW